MLNFVLYILPILILFVGLTLYFIGRTKEKTKMWGIGIGIIVCLIVLNLPNFTKGFIEGFANGVNF